MCIQINFFGLDPSSRETLGSEDCLYLNVFTPVGAKDKATRLPVMVFIHGGAFFCGSAMEYPPKVLLDHDIILVVLQYRMGVLGFLSTEDDVLPGNMGLLDQVEALRWVQNNIGRFGGDPSAVTIFGESAGGSSVSYHLLSPLTEGLFARAISQSGSALSPCGRGGSFRQVAERLGRDLNCPDPTDSHALLECLQKAPAHDVAAFLYDIKLFTIDPVLFGPRVDGVYLPEDPAILLRDGRHKHVPLMTGITAHEGSFTTSQMFGKPSLTKLLTESSEVQEASLELVGEENPSELASRIFSHYLGGRHFGEDRWDEMTEMFGDRLFVVAIEELSRRYSRMAPTYTYELTHHSKSSLAVLFSLRETPPRKWVCHGDELFYLFAGGMLFDAIPLSEPVDLQMRDLISKLWVNFATTGNPTPDDSLGFTWTPIDPTDPYHLDLKLSPVMTPNYRQKVLDFWSSLPLKENLLMTPEKVVHEGHCKDEL